MKLKMINEFSCSPELLWEIFEDPEFDRRLEEETGVRREVLEAREEDGGVLYKKLRCISLKELPAMMKKALGTEHLEFEQENHLDLQKSELRWVVNTPFLSDRVDAGGTTRVEATENGSRRVVTGEIVIRLPVVGKKMEQRLGGNIEESYQKAAAIAAKMVEERQAQQA